jgi:hypothetical protein
MDAKTNMKARLPSRHMTKGPERAPAAPTAFDLPAAPCMPAAERMCDPCAVAFELSGGAAVFKRTPSVLDLKPAGRYVAKDLFEADVKKPKLSGPSHCLDAEEACFEEACFVTTRKYREGDGSVIRDAGRKCGSAATALAKDLFKHSQVTIRRAGAVTHPGGTAEVRSYADI